MVSQSVVPGPVPSGHVVQFYGDDSRPLVVNASRFLADALNRGNGALIIATPAHCNALYEELSHHGISPRDAELEHRLLGLDAGRTLAQFMIAGQPDWNRFESVIGGIIGEIHADGGSAFGEMVGLLWKAGRFDEAICLESYWNRLLESSGYNLFCGYPVDVLAEDFHSNAIDAVLTAHSHLVPSNDKLEPVLHRAMDEILGPLGAQIRGVYAGQRAAVPSCLPAGEGLVRWLRAHMPEDADKILKRTRRLSSAHEHPGRPNPAAPLTFAP